MYTLIIWIEYMIRTSNVWNKEWYTLEEFAQRTYMARKPDFSMAVLTDLAVLGIILIVTAITVHISNKKTSSKAEP